MHPVHYAICPGDPARHRFEVTLTIASPDPAGQRVAMPAWIPGSYMVREFAKHVVRIEGRIGGAAVPLARVDRDTWQAPPTDGRPLVIRYEVHAWDLSVRKAHLDRTHGFFNGTSLCLEVEGQTDGPHGVTLLPPTVEACADWKVATMLTRVDGDDWGFGTFEAADHDELIDHPVEMGTFDVVDFEACGIPHHLVLTGVHDADTERLARDLSVICSHHLEAFGAPYPIDRYLFLTMVVGDGYGGLEHRSSTALVCKRADLPRRGDPETSDGYRNFLGLCSHEYLHTWNVKRLKPAAFVPYDLHHEAHTELLWWFEGVTSYLDDLGVLRAGLIDATSWMELVGRTATRVLRGGGRHVQSVAESSFDAWSKFYKQDEDAPNAVVSYYAKGSLVAMALDLELRRRTDDRVGLTTVMATLWQRYGDGRGVPEADIEAVCSELAGAPMDDFFALAVHGVADLPLPELLERVGIVWNTRAATGDTDRGGKTGKLPDGGGGDLGVVVAKHAMGSKLKSVLDGGAACAAGLAPGDVVIALDGLQVKGDLTARALALPPGRTVRVHAFRRDELVETTAVLQPAPSTTVFLTQRDSVDEATATRRQHWLDGTTTG